MEEAIEFLTAELENGERHPAKELTGLARSLGHSTGTLHAAKKRLGVQTEKAGFGGGWEWWLPKIQSSSEPWQRATSEPSQEPFAQASSKGVRSSEDSASDTLSLGVDEDEIERLADVWREAQA